MGAVVGGSGISCAAGSTLKPSAVADALWMCASGHDLPMGETVMKTRCLCAFAISVMMIPAPEARCDVALPAPPRTTAPARQAVPGYLAERTVYERTLPRFVADRGPAPTMRRVVADPLQRSRAVGYLAEEDYLARNPAWSKVRKANAPQNDVFTFVQGRFHGGQIKTHASGAPHLYMRDMLKDHLAEHFLVPDDHYPAVRRSIEERIGLMRQRGNAKGAAQWQRQLQRLKPLGRSYRQLETSLVSQAGKVIHRGRYAAGYGAAAYFMVALAVEGGVVIYRSMSGELTGAQVNLAAGEGFVKASAAGLATGGAILAGANPIGITVLVIGGVTYFIVDLAVSHARPNYWTSPMTVAEIQAAMPPGWRLQDPLARQQ